MPRYIVKRLLYMIPLLFFVIMAVFLIMSLLPGDPASNILPATTLPEVKQAYNESVGFTGSLPSRFFNYLKGLFTGKVISYQTQKNVFDELAVRFPVTLKLGLISFSLAVVIGVALGILSAVRQYSFIDFAVTTLSVLFASIPSFFVAMLLMYFLSIRLGWLPDRLVTVQYLGCHRFAVLESLNSSLKQGDSFECAQIQTGRPLYLDRFRRTGSDAEARYVAGEKNGLTLVELI